MSYIPSPSEAMSILKKYNTQQFHILHAATVGTVMRHFASLYDKQNQDYWESVGILHDIDYELYPDEHCFKAQIILKDMDIEENMIKSIASHGYGICSDIKPESYMEKLLYAADELTGLIWATALMRPSKSVMDLETKSVLKKFKQPSFAAAINRQVILDGAGMLDLDIEKLIFLTIEGMRKMEQ
ncbi:MAG: hydrolase [Clostridia bacterium]